MGQGFGQWYDAGGYQVARLVSGRLVAVDLEFLSD